MAKTSKRVLILNATDAMAVDASVVAHAGIAAAVEVQEVGFVAANGRAAPVRAAAANTQERGVLVAGSCHNKLQG